MAVQEHEIAFTQYMQPDGRKVVMACPAAPEIAQMAREVISHGLVFEAEVLMTREVSFTVSDGEEDKFIEVCANGPQVRGAIEKLVRNAHASLAIAAAEPEGIADA